MLSLKQVATRLGVSEATVRMLVKTKQIQGIRVGGQIRISEEALNTYISKASL